MENKTEEKITITLTGKLPVKITPSSWPVIAEASDKQYDNRYEFQANRMATWKLIVRQHNDGRTIVYGIYNYITRFEGEAGANIRGGEMLTVPGADARSIGDAERIIAAIERVGAALEERLPESGKWDKGYFPRLVHECIGDLPALDLDPAPSLI